MAAFCWVIKPEQHVESKAPDPESLGRLQVMTRPGDTQVTSWDRLHGPIFAESERLAQRGSARIGRPGRAPVMRFPSRTTNVPLTMTCWIPVDGRVLCR